MFGIDFIDDSIMRAETAISIGDTQEARAVLAGMGAHVAGLVWISQVLADLMESMEKSIKRMDSEDKPGNQGER